MARTGTATRRRLLVCGAKVTEAAGIDAVVGRMVSFETLDGMGGR